MIKKLMELIRNALAKMTAYKNIADVVSDSVYTVSEKMNHEIDKWKKMYKDESEWLNEDEGVYSLGLPKLICQMMSTLVLSEVKSTIVEQGKEEIPTDDSVKTKKPNTRANFLNDLYQKRLLKNLSKNLERAMALGGMIIKPYVSNDTVYFDFNIQGEFYPISFDDDGNIIDIAFIDQFITGDKLYTKVERQTFNGTTIAIENKAFETCYNGQNEDVDLGHEISLESIDRWKDIIPEITIVNVEKPLYGFYKVPLANNIDTDCPLGISVFSPAVKMIERADHQFSRLDWEYDGGQMAIDVDPTALRYSDGYYGTQKKSFMDRLRNRLYRKIDLGQDDTYHEFAPSLRDENYMNGLNSYLMRIEDLVGLARGTLGDVQSEARTATEIKVLKQRTYNTVNDHQSALEQALNDVIYATNALVELYNLAPKGEYVTNTEWQDSVLTDTDTELTQKLQLQDAGILSKAEVRAWYTGEDLVTAQAKIDDIDSEETNTLMNDIFTQQQESTLEADEDVAEENEE